MHSPLKGRITLTQSSPAKFQSNAAASIISSRSNSFQNLIQFQEKKFDFASFLRENSEVSFGHYLQFLTSLLQPLNEDESSISLQNERENQIINEFVSIEKNVSAFTQNSNLLGLLFENLGKNFRWGSATSEGIFAGLSRFVSILLSTHTWTSSLIIGFCLTSFLVPPFKPDKNRYTQTELDDAKLGAKRGHQLLQLVFETVPSSLNLFKDRFSQVYPIYRNSNREWNPQMASIYVENGLGILNYSPQLTGIILSVIIEEILKTDVFIKLEDVPDDDDELEGEECLFPVELDQDGTILGNSALLNHRKMALRATELDYLMLVMFKWIDTKVSTASMEDQSNLFRVFLEIFDRMIIQTRQSKYTQFLLFFMIQKNPSLLNDFLGYLTTIVGDFQQSSFKRQTSSTYVASFLARSTFVSMELVEKCIIIFADFLHTYLDRYQNSIVALDYEQHILFYTVAQCTFYIICFHHNNLIELNPDYLTYFDFQRIVRSAFNPFKFCLPEVVKEFSKICEKSGISFSDVIDNNNRIVVTSKMKAGAHGVDAYFPFDPYLLEESSIYIKNNYRNWQSEDIEESDYESEASSSQLEDIDDASGSFRAMSITPKYHLSSSYGFSSSPNDYSPKNRYKVR